MGAQQTTLANSLSAGDSPSQAKQIDPATITGIFFDNESASSGDEVALEAKGPDGNWYPVDGFEAITNGDMLSTDETSGRLWTAFSPTPARIRVVVKQGTWSVYIEHA